MKVVTFLLTIIIGMSIVAGTYVFFLGLQQDFSSASSVKTLQGATSTVASNVITAYGHARKSSFYSQTEPAAQITLALPRKIGESDYKINLTGNSVRGWSGMGNSTVSIPLPFNVNSSGLIESQRSPHVLKAYRTNEDTVIFIIS